VYEALTERGGRLALATDCKGPELKHYLSLLHIDEFIGATACGDDVEHGKPDPRIVGVALRKLGLTGPEAVMIGDTPYDAEAASGAGTAAAAVLTGGFTVEALRGAGCVAVADEISRLLAAPKPSRTEAGRPLYRNISGRGLLGLQLHRRFSPRGHNVSSRKEANVHRSRRRTGSAFRQHAA
jgi:hypothetical protein